MPNTIIDEYRQQFPKDGRSDDELLQLLGAWNDHDGRFNDYPDFVQEYEALKSRIAQAYTKPKPESSAVGSFARGAARQVLPAIATAAGALGAGALAAPTGPGAVPAAIAGGAAAGAAARKIQDAIIPPDEEQLALDEKEHPIALRTGQFLGDAPSMFGGAGFGKKIAGSLVAKGLSEKAAERIGALAENSIAGAVMSGSSAAQQVAQGKADLSAIPEEAIKGAVTMTPVGFIPHAASVFGSIGWKAPTDAAVLALSNAIYDQVVHDKPIDPVEISKQTGMDIPGFMLMNGLAAVFHKTPWLPTKDGKIESPKTGRRPVRKPPVQIAPLDPTLEKLHFDTLSQEHRDYIDSLFLTQRDGKATPEQQQEIRNLNRVELQYWNSIAARVKELPTEETVSAKTPAEPAADTSAAASTLSPEKKGEVTPEMDKALADLGYNETDRKNITPEDAQSIIAAGLRSPKEKARNAAVNAIVEQADPAVAKAREKVEKAAAKTDTAPTEEQKESGKYKKGQVTIQGVTIDIENPKDSTRSGTGPDGKSWSVTMPAHYGEIPGAKGADHKPGSGKDWQDVYIGPNPTSEKVFVVDQINLKDGTFDEHKNMIGFNTREEALAAYDAAFSDGTGHRRRGAVTEMSMDQFKDWLKSGKTKEAIAYKQPPERERVLSMPAGEFFDTAEQWTKDKAAGKEGAISPQTRAEQAAAEHPDKTWWEASYKLAADEARRIQKEVAENPGTMMARQKEMMGAAQKAQYFQEGLKALKKAETESKEPSAKADDSAKSAQTTTGSNEQKGSEMPVQPKAGEAAPAEQPKPSDEPIVLTKKKTGPEKDPTFFLDKEQKKKSDEAKAELKDAIDLFNSILDEDTSATSGKTFLTLNPLDYVGVNPKLIGPLTDIARAAIKLGFYKIEEFAEYFFRMAGKRGFEHAAATYESVRRHFESVGDKESLAKMTPGARYDTNKNLIKGSGDAMIEGLLRVSEMVERKNIETQKKHVTTYPADHVIKAEDISVDERAVAHKSSRGRKESGVAKEEWDKLRSAERQSRKAEDGASDLPVWEELSNEARDLFIDSQPGLRDRVNAARDTVEPAYFSPKDQSLESLSKRLYSDSSPPSKVDGNKPANSLTFRLAAIYDKATKKVHVVSAYINNGKPFLTKFGEAGKANPNYKGVSLEDVLNTKLGDNRNRYNFIGSFRTNDLTEYYHAEYPNRKAYDRFRDDVQRAQSQVQTAAGKMDAAMQAHRAETKAGLRESEPVHDIEDIHFEGGERKADTEAQPAPEITRQEEQLVREVPEEQDMAEGAVHEANSAEQIEGSGSINLAPHEVETLYELLTAEDLKPDADGRLDVSDIADYVADGGASDALKQVFRKIGDRETGDPEFFTRIEEVGLVKALKEYGYKTDTAKSRKVEPGTNRGPAVDLQHDQRGGAQGNSDAGSPVEVGQDRPEQVSPVGEPEGRPATGAGEGQPDNTAPEVVHTLPERAPADLSTESGYAAELVRAIHDAARRAGIKVDALSVDNVLTKSGWMGGAGAGRYLRKKRTIIQVIGSAIGRTDVQTAIHEVAHDVFANETPEVRARLLKAINKLTDTEIGVDLSADPRIRSSDPTGLGKDLVNQERLVESTAMKLVDEGFNPDEARSFSQRFVRALKDFYYQAADLAQRLLGFDSNPEMARRYFENRVKRLLAGDHQPLSYLDFVGARKPTQAEAYHRSYRTDSVRGEQLSQDGNITYQHQPDLDPLASRFNNDALFTLKSEIQSMPNDRFNFFVMTRRAEIENAILYLNREKPNIEEAEYSKQQLLKSAPNAFKGEISNTDFTNIEAIKRLNESLIKQTGEAMKWGAEWGAVKSKTQTDTPEFKAWFGDSKVVDKDGKPLAVVHGSSRGGIERTKGGFSFYTDSPEIGNSYAIGGRATVQKDYLKIEKPLVIDAGGKVWTDIEWQHPGDRSPYRGTADIAQGAFLHGYDGVIIRNIIDPHSRLITSVANTPSDVYVVLGGRGAIKSAIGNRGTFDPKDPDILHTMPAPAPDATRKRTVDIELRAAQLNHLAGTIDTAGESLKSSSLMERIAEIKSKKTGAAMTPSQYIRRILRISDPMEAKQELSHEREFGGNEAVAFDSNKTIDGFKAASNRAAAVRAAYKNVEGLLSKVGSARLNKADELEAYNAKQARLDKAKQAAADELKKAKDGDDEKVTGRKQLLFDRASRRASANKRRIARTQLDIKALDTIAPSLAKEKSRLGARMGVGVEAVWRDGMPYNVVSDPNAASDKIIGSGVKQVKLNSHGEVTNPLELEADIRRNVEFLRAREAKARAGDENALDEVYHGIKNQTDELAAHKNFTVRVGVAQRFMRGLSLSPTGKMLADAIGTPVARGADRMLNTFNQVMESMHHDNLFYGRKSVALEDKLLKLAPDLSRESLRQDVLYVAMHTMEHANDLAELHADNRAAMDRAIFQRVREKLLTNELTKQHIGPVIDKFMPLLIETVRHKHEANQYQERMVRSGGGINKNLGLDVLDPKTKALDPTSGERKVAARQAIPLGPYTFSQRFSARARTMAQALMGSHWEALDTIVDNVAELYGQDPEGLRAKLLKFTNHPDNGHVVRADFLEPLATMKDNTSFLAPVKEGEVVRSYADPELVHQAFEESGAVETGDMVAFAEKLHELHGGEGNKTAFVQDTIGVFNDIYKELHTKLLEHEGSDAEKSVAIRGMIHGSMINSRTVDHLPGQWFDYHSYDERDMFNTSQSIAGQTAFGRGGERMAQAFETMGNESRLAQRKLDIAARAIKQSNPKATEKEIREALVKKFGAEQYRTLKRQAQSGKFIADAVRGLSDYFRRDNSPDGSIKATIRVLGTIGNLMINQPASAIRQLEQFGSVFLKFGLSRETARAAGHGVKEFSTEVAGSLAQALGMVMRNHSEDHRLYVDNRLVDPGVVNTWRGAFDKLEGEGNTSRVMRGMQNVLGMTANWHGDKDQYTGLRPLQPFTTTSIMVDKGLTAMVWQMARIYGAKGVEYYKTNREGYYADGFKLTADHLGLKGTSAHSFNRFVAEMARHGVDFDDMVRGSIERNDRTLFSDEEAKRLYELSVSELSSESNISTMPLSAYNNSVIRVAAPLLGWPFRRMMDVVASGRTPEGRIELQTIARGLAGLSVMALGGLGVSALANAYQEDLLGKKSNLRPMLSASNPKELALGIFENLNRAGTFGLLGEAANGIANVGLGGDNRSILDANSRVLALSTISGVQQAVSSFINQGGQADYTHVIRPLISSVGGGGLLQYMQLANNTLGFDNMESRTVARINAKNYLQVMGRQLGMEVRAQGGSGYYTPNALSPALTRMELAAYGGDRADFMDAFREAVAKAKEMGEADPVDHVKRAFAGRNPLRSVFRTPLSKADYQRILENLPDAGRKDVTEAVDGFNNFAEAIGARPFEGAKPKTTSQTSLRNRSVEAILN